MDLNGRGMQVDGCVGVGVGRLVAVVSWVVVVVVVVVVVCSGKGHASQGKGRDTPRSSHHP